MLSLFIILRVFPGLVSEILLLRELLIVFAGNELSIGLILAGWLILEAGMMLRLQEMSYHNINLVTPTHYSAICWPINRYMHLKWKALLIAAGRLPFCSCPDCGSNVIAMISPCLGM
jgi:hypothetical protein